MNSQTIFPTYNARHYGPIEVAKTFIWSESFERLIQNNHSVILGARGCGKTTLMKMLTLPALENWESDISNTIKNNMPFYAIYISTDIYWDVKSDNYKKQLVKYGNLSEVISRFSVSSNVFTSICDTFFNIIQYELSNTTEEQEFELCENLIQIWKLPKTIPKLSYVKEALDRRIDDVNQMVQNLIFNPNKDEKFDYPEFFNLSFETSVETIIPIFKRIYSKSGNLKKWWALCFDELEFAPLWLQSELFKSLRSRKHFIIYKLSASPILSSNLENSLKDAYRATAGNDYELIKMWNLKDHQKFSKKIISSLLNQKYPSANINSFFKHNNIYSGDADSYKENSEFYHQLKELINKDSSFRSFLLKKNVDLKLPIPKSESEKDTLFRKIKPIVYYRNFFLKEDGKKFRSRKKNELISGIEVLSEICDGNPRWLIGITTSILNKSNESGAPRNIQYSEIFSAAKRFENVIRNIPVGNNNLTIVDLIDRIGSYFEDQILGHKFRMDPNATFIVDNSESIPMNILELIEKGVSQGAFILLDTNDDAFDFEIRKQRFKLSYLFHAIYHLPIRKYDKERLSKCLKGIDLSVSENQTSLFDN